MEPKRVPSRPGHPRLRNAIRGIALLLLASALTSRGVDSQNSVKEAGWVETMISARAALAGSNVAAPEQGQAAPRIWLRIKEDFPVQWDWLLQDGGAEVWRWLYSTDTSTLENLAAKALMQLESSTGPLGRELDFLARTNDPAKARPLLRLYEKICEQRRQQRLRTMLAVAPRIVFTKHRTIRPSFFAYTEGQSDAQGERHFLPGSELCLLEMQAGFGKTRTLLADPAGAIRDPAVSWDGARVLFAWKKALDDDDYHLYEFNVISNTVRQITSGEGSADYEPAYLPNGDLIFASTRCVQTVDCWWTEVSNLFTCDADGGHLHRLTWDQVHSIYPQVMDDGRVIYTRWDYNDRGQIFPQALFQMFQDGTGQMELYGNNSWFPTTIAHARGIPGTAKVLAILCGHHTSQAGKLAVIDPARGRQENSGVQLVAPIRDTPAERIDAYGQEGELWQYPYPLNDRECLVIYAPGGWDQPEGRRDDADFGIYWMDFDGHRELLAWDAKLPCSQPVPLAPRRRPLVWANRVDYSKATGTYYVQDIYAGPGLAGVPRGTIKKLRVVALEYRAAGIGHNGSAGPGGEALVCTPVSVGNGSWDVKKVLGDARVYEDGSALFLVPARTPVYFQALDDRGRAVQTMRSWSTLQPNEFLGCVGCHENKNTFPPTEGYGFNLAMKAGAQPLEDFYGPPRGFSFAREIQPILDRHCIRCHKDREAIQKLVETGRPVLAGSASVQANANGGTNETSFSLLGEVTADHTAKRAWSDAYLVLTRARLDERDEMRGAFIGDNQGPLVSWISSQSVPELLPPDSAGSRRSELLGLLERGHKAVTLSREELDKIACWIDLLVPYCGDYFEANLWTQAEMRKYRFYANKRQWEQEAEEKNIRALLPQKPVPPLVRPAPGPSRPMLPGGSF